MKNKRSPFVTTVGSIFLGANLSLCLKTEEPPPIESDPNSENNVEEMRTGNPPIDSVHEKKIDKPIEETVTEPAKEKTPPKRMVNPPSPNKK